MPWQPISLLTTPAFPQHLSYSNIPHGDPKTIKKEKFDMEISTCSNLQSVPVLIFSVKASLALTKMCLKIIPISSGLEIHVPIMFSLNRK